MKCNFCPPFPWPKVRKGHCYAIQREQYSQPLCDFFKKTFQMFRQKTGTYNTRLLFYIDIRINNNFSSIAFMDF